MKTYKQVFSELNRAALIPFFVIGDPDGPSSLDLIKAAVDAGADILELGIPFSDPVADGPTIQKADIRALKSGMNVKKALYAIRQIRDYTDVPIGLLMYYNLITKYGTPQFYRDCDDAGVNSVLVADVTIDDADELTGPASDVGLDTVFMVTPNTSDARLKIIAEKTTGFIYTVSLLGVTGGRDQLSDHVESLVRRIKAATDVPVCVGFGVSKPEHALAIANAGADGVIIGSKIVKFIEDNPGDTKKAAAMISSFIKNVLNTMKK